MNPSFESSAFSTYALCSAILALKMIASAIYTSSRRFKVQGYANEEDASFFGKDGVAARPDEALEVARALRIQRNDLENIPLFWIVGLVYVVTAASDFGAAVYCWTFTVARILHTIVYMRGVQPFRALCWGVGVLCVVGMSVQVISHAL